jgi:uncharacterized protein Smg (DUF494 family)
MKAPITEIITVILQRLEQRPESKLSDPGLRRWLTRKGYSLGDIETAIHMMQPRSDVPERRMPGAVRQFAPHEMLKLSPEVRDTFARLDLYEMLDPFTRELIIDRLSQFEGEVGMEELDYALSWAFAPARDVETIQTLYTIFDGASETVH